MDIKGLLKQYNSLIDEIKTLKRRIKELENFKVEHDKVSGSNIQDIDKANKLKKILIKRKCRCEDLKLEIEKFIDTIPDSRTRRVFQYKYIDNLSWQAVARRIGKSDESYPRKEIHNKYLNNL